MAITSEGKSPMVLASIYRQFSSWLSLDSKFLLCEHPTIQNPVPCEEPVDRMSSVRDGNYRGAVTLKRFGRVTTAVAVAWITLVGAISNSQATPVGGLGTIRYGQSQLMGIDTCAAPSASAMNTWWTNSPYWDIGIYIGGVNRGCSQPNLTPTWVENVHNNDRWSYYLIWVGLQAPCSAITSQVMSSNQSTATSQGRQAADNAVSAASNLGFTGRNSYYFDMEFYDTSNSTCRAAVNAFVNGWSAELQDIFAEKAGVYGSACGSAVNDWWSLVHRPDNVWIADWNNDPDVWGLVCVPNDHFVGGHRIHQYSRGHNETFGGVTINIDNDCAYGLVTPHGHGVGGDPACTTE